MPTKAIMTERIMSVLSADEACLPPEANALPIRLNVHAAGRTSVVLPAAEDRFEPLLDAVRAAQDLRNTDAAADNRKHGEDHQGYGHHLRRLVDVVLHLFGGPALAKEGIEEHPEHVEGRQPAAIAAMAQIIDRPPALNAFQRISSLLKKPEKGGRRRWRHSQPRRSST